MVNLLENIGAKVSAIVELAKTLGNSELMLEIAELQVRLADLKIEHAAIKNENREVKAKLEEREANPLSYDGLVYRDADNHPYCPTCYGMRKDRLLLNPFNSNIHGLILTCGSCNAEYYANRFDD